MKTFDKILKKENDDAKVYENSLREKSKKLLKWCEDDGWNVKDTLIVLHAAMNGLKTTMESKTEPIIKEWNAKSLKDFYAAPPAS